MAFALFLLDAVDRAGRRVVRAQPLCRGVVENVDEQRTTLVCRARGEGVQHFRDHADRDLVDSLAFEVLAKAPEMHGIQADPTERYSICQLPAAKRAVRNKGLKLLQELSRNFQHILLIEDV